MNRRFCCEHPWVLLAIAVLGFNDHFLKTSSHAGLLTGKISDFAGMFFFPFLLFDLCKLAMRRACYDAIIWWVCLASSAGFFIGLKSCDWVVASLRFIYAAVAYRISIIQDPWDLLALFMLPWSHLLFRSMKGETYVATDSISDSNV